jgi:hypothetical protein
LFRIEGSVDLPRAQRVAPITEGAELTLALDDDRVLDLYLNGGRS